MEAAGLPAPEYKETSNTVKLILRNNIDERTAQKPVKASDGALNGALNGGLNIELTDDEVIIVQILTDDSHLTKVEIAGRAEFSLRKTERLMKNLVEKNVIARKGAKKSGQWRVLADNERI